MKKSSVILLSGGMDSLLCLALSHQRSDTIFTLHFNYGQRTFLKEKESAEQIAKHYNIPTSQQKIIDLTFLKDFGGSALTDSQLQLSTTGENLTKNTIPSSYVPYRNTIMLSIALSYAEIMKANNIVIGAVQDDELGYPDCRKLYFDSFEKMAVLGGNSQNITIETPLIHLTKIEILTQLIKLKSPLEKSWSCYQTNQLACGVCDSCRLRLNAFKKLNVTDPLKYQ